MRHLNSHQEFATALSVTALGAVSVLFAAGRPWVRAQAVAEPLRVALAVRGGSLSPVVPALGLVALAGIVAILAARGRARRLVGLLLVGAGAGSAAAALNAVGADSRSLADRAGDAVGGASARAEFVEVTWWPWIAVLGGVLCVAGGVLTLLRGGGWPGMSARYDAPGGEAGPPARAQDPPRTTLDQWRALDRGEDPTLDTPGPERT